MTYALAPALQAAIYARLTADPALAALVGAHIYDALPPGILPSLYVALGPETARDRSDTTGAGAEHEVTVTVVTDRAGFATAKQAAAAVSDALHGADLTLARGTSVFCRFLRARAARSGEAREIVLTFRVRVDA